MVLSEMLQNLFYVFSGKTEYQEQVEKVKDDLHVFGYAATREGPLYFYIVDGYTSLGYPEYKTGFSQKDLDSAVELCTDAGYVYNKKALIGVIGDSCHSLELDGVGLKFIPNA